MAEAFIKLMEQAPPWPQYPSEAQTIARRHGGLVRAAQPSAAEARSAGLEARWPRWAPIVELSGSEQDAKRQRVVDLASGSERPPSISISTPCKRALLTLCVAGVRGCALRDLSPHGCCRVLSMQMMRRMTMRITATVVMMTMNTRALIRAQRPALIRLSARQVRRSTCPMRRRGAGMCPA